jgi:hypothetical protein
MNNKLEWRNGRRNGLKIRWWQHREGSSPSSSTNFLLGLCNWKHRRAYTSYALDVGRAQVRFLHLTPIYRLIAQWLEQGAHNALVGGSNPSGPNLLKGRYRSGQTGRTVNPLAYAFTGSNPVLPTWTCSSAVER